jgi:IS30 family transposase
MPMERMSMRRVREIMRLKTAGVPTREISRRAGVAPATIRLTLRRFEASGLSWPLRLRPKSLLGKAKLSEH